jgi:hypothetical protein
MYAATLQPTLNPRAVAAARTAARRPQTPARVYSSFWLAQAAPLAAPEVEQTPRACPRCAAPADADYRYCDQCGTPIAATLSPIAELHLAAPGALIGPGPRLISHATERQHLLLAIWSRLDAGDINEAVLLLRQADTLALLTAAEAIVAGAEETMRLVLPAMRQLVLFWPRSSHRAAQQLVASAFGLPLHALHGRIVPQPQQEAAVIPFPARTARAAA